MRRMEMIVLKIKLNPGNGGTSLVGIEEKVL